MSEDTDLGRAINAEIAATGPISLAAYMARCLTDPARGYYRTGNPLGAKGAFVTAPDISQMFGEMIGLWALEHWTRLGEPERFELVELGPGRGTLMADLLRVATRHPGFRAGLRLTLLETSPDLKAEQTQRLAPFAPRHIGELAELTDDAPLLVVANEFFDALPIRQYQKANERWHERVVGLKDGRRAFGLDPTPLPGESLPPSFQHAPDGAIHEVALTGASVMSELAAQLVRRTGAALIVDYGYGKTQTGDTLQALRGHAYADPLEAPGTADISAHVDFEALAEAAVAAGAKAAPLATQGGFLTAYGIARRAEQLVASNADRAEALKTDLDRLIAPDQMGDLFKVLSLVADPAAPRPEAAPALTHLPNIAHGFFNRLGGVSSGPWFSLNLSDARGDEPEAVAANRAQVAATLGLAADSLMICRQTHSSLVETLTGPFPPDQRPEADAMVTATPGLALGILTADCTPVLFADPDANVIGAAHAGWKGAVTGIIEHTIAAMVALGAEPARILAAVGPNISAANYEVGPDFAARIRAEYPDAAPFIVCPQGATREHFDVAGVVRQALQQAGITRIETVGGCTYAHPGRYFSHRYATHHGIAAGRQVAVIAIRK